MIKKIKSKMRFVTHDVLTDKEINKHYNDIIAKSISDCYPEINQGVQDFMSDMDAYIENEVSYES